MSVVITTERITITTPLILEGQSIDVSSESVEGTAKVGANFQGQDINYAMQIATGDALTSNILSGQPISTNMSTYLGTIKVSGSFQGQGINYSVNTEVGIFTLASLKDPILKTRLINKTSTHSIKDKTPKYKLKQN